jgi:hypothetical protein
MKNREKITPDWNKEIHPLRCSFNYNYKFIEFVSLLSNILVHTCVVRGNKLIKIVITSKSITVVRKASLRRRIWTNKSYIKTFVSRRGIMQCFDTDICYIRTADSLHYNLKNQDYGTQENAYGR